MKKRFYYLALLPLLFGACNSLNSQTAEPKGKSQTAVKFTKKATSSREVSSSNSNIKYISKPLIIEQGMLHIKGFMGTLKPTLQSALKQDKTGEIAMGACSTMAMQMTNDYNNITHGVKVRRTALKYRNPQNRPDSTDKEVMYRLQAVNNDKAVAVDMGNSYRIYKPLKTKFSCLACHGDSSQISPKVTKLINAKYPHDLAVGFKVGDFRGAVVAEVRK